MAAVPPELLAHREWLGQIAPVGLVVSPQVLLTRGVFVDRQRAIVAQTRLADLVVEDEDERPRIEDVLAVFREVLEWPDGVLAGGRGGPALPDALTVALPEYEDRLAPTYALPDPEKAGEWLILVQVVESGMDLDKVPSPDKQHSGWRASPHARLERLLRETGVAIGVLFNGASLRLVYAPRGESSGQLTFRFADLIQTQGRPMAGALCALLAVERVTDLQAESQRLASLLRESRKYQNEVSTELAGQVLEALWELVRGFQKANEDAKGELLARALRESPQDVYGGLLSTLMRLVFILYAEDRTLMPQSEVYQRHYSLSGLFEHLRDDQARYPDTMDARYGAWAQLLALFRLIHDGGGHGDLRFVSRHGRLFNPDAYPFLEGRPPGIARQKGVSIDPPRISDGVVYRVLRNLLVLNGERLSYRALDVEQIGSVYEAMMGFALEEAAGPSLALSPKHIVVNLAELLEVLPKERVAWLRERSELKFTGDTLAKAGSVDELVAALGKKTSRYTPHVLPIGALYLQPTEERRRSGSHYTPRSLTQPIVSTTFRPIFERLGDAATPEQILDLKVCDPAMGSGAFLVEACRLLAERLVRAWEIHKSAPKVPDDEDVLTYARRLVAERCLYGVDKNVFAVDLAKLSLWLATLAKEHPFTFLDHALRNGDSLVGLSREQIACLHWLPTKQLPLIRTFIDARVAEAQRLRLEIQSMGASDDIPEKARLLREAEDAIAEVQVIGDAVISAFFEGGKPRERETLRVAYAGKVDKVLDAVAPSVASNSRGTQTETRLELRAIQDALRTGNRPIPAFHWEVEFPEVFTRGNGGFDAFVGNPPFLRGKKVSTHFGDSYRDWQVTSLYGVNSSSDLVAYFFRWSFDRLRRAGTLGMVATNTIAQGDTRETGLQRICERDGVIFEARRRISWPGSAAVIVSSVHLARGGDVRSRILDGRPVSRISAYLAEGEVDARPAALVANAALSYHGSIILGSGFLFDDSDDQASPLEVLKTILKEPRNGKILKPYIGGEDVNSSPTFSVFRHVIDFGSLTLADAEKYPELLAIVRARVKPHRDSVKRDVYRTNWWRFGERQNALYAAIQPLKRVLVCCQVSPHLSFAFLPSGFVFSYSLNVFVFEADAAFATLQSRVHELWARAFGSTMKDDLRYAPTDCFETFPLPAGMVESSGLMTVGREYYDLRSALMVRHNEGLTKTYNRFHDPDQRDSEIEGMRSLHDVLDRAVLDSYGWIDIQPRCEFILDYEDEEEDTSGKANKKRKPWRYRWPDDIRDEVLGRLLALNAERATAEAEIRNQSDQETAKKRRTSRRKVAGTGPLFG